MARRMLGRRIVDVHVVENRMKAAKELSERFVCTTVDVWSTKHRI